MKNKTYCIAEVGINHNGSMTIARQLIDIAAASGCDAVKFQKRTIDKVYTKEELDAPRQSPWGTTNRQQKEGLEFTIEQYIELEKYTKEKDLDFIVSCWDIDSLLLIDKNINVKYHKVASALLTDKEFLQALNKTGKPVILSTGMSSLEEIDKAYDILNDVSCIMVCTSTYPTIPEEVHLKRIESFSLRYGNISQIGFSNHYNGILACIGAVAIGATFIEFHITRDRAMYGSDQAASIQDVDVLMKSIRTMETLLGLPQIEMLDSEIPVMKKLRKTNTI